MKKPLLPFSYFIALRYLRPKRTFLSVITLISIIGVVLGISVLIIVISVMTGFERELERKVIGFEAHITISPGPNSFLINWRDAMKVAEKVPGVIGVTPTTQEPVIVEFKPPGAPATRMTVVVRGLDPSLGSDQVIGLKSAIIAGKFDLNGDKCVLGSELAGSLGLEVGDKLTLYSGGNPNHIIDLLKQAQDHPDNKESIQKAIDLIVPTELEVTGIYSTGRYVYDSSYVIAPLNVGQELYGLEDAVHNVLVKTSDPYNVDGITAQLNRELEPLNPPLHAVSWIEQNREYLDALRVERTTMFFILTFVVIVAAFGIMSTLITTTVQKTREIGVMKALGATMGQMLWAFLAQGTLVGFFGTLIGLGTGIFLVQYRNQVRDFLASAFHIQLFPASVYQFSEIPAEIVPHDVAVICISGFVICTVAALIPAFFAARLDPVKALRFE
ncbi:MAG: ABC transporter permease [Verrucomicrobia bacterium]|nr:ABC transporter permease [Verrucomicrobiota bacterium]